ncbi:MAG: amidohydrolase [Eubacteriales bacterium]|nr:amidohydrolase [Eubacteriales bacterium]
MLLVQNGLLYTMEDEAPVRADLLARDGKIARIAPRIEPESGMRVMNAAGLRVLPGLIDAHSHIGISEEKAGKQGDDCNEGTNPLTPCLRAIDAINPMDSAFHNALAAGVTGAMIGPGSSNPIGGQFAFLKTVGRRVDDMVVLAPAAVKLAFGENPKVNYGLNGNLPSTRMGIASLIREELFLAKRYFDAGQSGDFGKECYRALFEGKIPLKAHAHRTDDIFTAIRIAEEFGLGLTLDHCTEGHLIAPQIAESGFPAIVGPSLASRSKNEVSQSDFKTAGVLHKAGVLVALTTDHPVSRIQYLPLCAALAAKEGLGEREALRAITINAARICRVDKRLGSLAVGKDADLAVFEGDPLTIAATVRATVIGGEAVYRSNQNADGFLT